VLPVDADRDGINEDLEQKLAQRFAPLIYVEPDVASVAPTLDGAAMLADGTGLASGQAIQLLTELSLGRRTFSIDSADNVGNRGTIKNGGLAKSLLAKLAAAASAIMIADAQYLIGNCP
jgi:hypothetical protein